MLKYVFYTHNIPFQLLVTTGTQRFTFYHFLFSRQTLPSRPSAKETTSSRDKIRKHHNFDNSCSICMQQKTYPEDTNTAPDLFRPPSAATASTLSKVVPDPMAETTTGSTAGESKQSSAGAAPDVVLRHINLNTSEDNPTMSNVVKTATYTWYSFIPLFLFFQFRRPANIYFLTICVLQVGTTPPPLALTLSSL